MLYFFKKFIIIYSILLCALLLSGNECHAWLFSKTGTEMLPAALKSTRPRSVQKCVDKLIKENNYSGILQLKNHVRGMIRRERNSLLRAGDMLNAKKVSKNVSPWVKIDRQITQYFKRTRVETTGKKNKKSLYHR